MINPISTKEWKIVALLAAIAAIIFIALEIIPSVSMMSKQDNGGKPISKVEATKLASAFAEELTGHAIKRADAYHQTNKEYTGYINKEKLTDKHRESFEKLVPYDQYQVNLVFDNNNGSGVVFLHLNTGEVSGWNLTIGGEPVTDEAAKEVIVATSLKQHYTVDARTSITSTDKEFTLSNDSDTVGEAKLIVKTEVKQQGDQLIVSKYQPSFNVPAAYLNNVKKQDVLAQWITYGGYFFLTIVLGVLAIIYAILYRKHTSFKYGAWLTAIAAVISFMINLNLLDSQVALEGGGIIVDVFAKGIMLIIVFISVIFGAIGMYFSFVAGDGLWKAQGYSLWPRFKDAGYGHYIVERMKIAYLLTFILLGLQTVIFLLLSLILGTWTANDTSQSFINMEYGWLFPAVAWLAAIGEEVTYRYFGVAIFRRWFKNTFVAAIIPTLIWAAGHTLYPLYPASTRLVELLIVGLAFTFIMMRFGFITAMFTHAIFNSIVIGISLIMLGNTIDITASIVFILLPIVIAYVIKWFHDQRQINKAQSQY